MDPDKIQATVRARYGAFKACYAQGLGRNPALSGRVSVRFVIERDGHVSEAEVAANTLPDCRAVLCVADAFRDLVFDKPNGGSVKVVYPILFEPAR